MENMKKSNNSELSEGQVQVVVKKKPLKKGFKFSENSLKNMEGVHEDLVAVAKEAIKTTKIDFGIPSTGGLRTGVEQKRLFQQGVTKADGLVHRSKHQDGLALDVFAYVAGSASWEPEHLTEISKAFKASAEKLGIDIVWGGDWKNFKDLPHYELPGSTRFNNLNWPSGT